MATVKLEPGVTFAGTWTIPMLIDNRREAIAGDLIYRPAPSPAWFWPIAVLIASTLALRRIGHVALTRRLTQVLSLATLVGIGIAAVALLLHGRPDVSPVGALAAGVILALVVAALARLVLGAAGQPLCFAVGSVGLLGGFDLLPSLLHGFVLMAVPALLARVATVLCLGAGTSLLVLVIWRIWDREASSEHRLAAPAGVELGAGVAAPVASENGHGAVTWRRRS